MNNKKLYEGIMKDVSKTVKKHLNEKFGDSYEKYELEIENIRNEVKKLQRQADSIVTQYKELLNKKLEPLNIQIEKLYNKETELLSKRKENLFNTIEQEDFDDIYNNIIQKYPELSKKLAYVVSVNYNGEMYLYLVFVGNNILLTKLTADIKRPDDLYIRAESPIMFKKKVNNGYYKIIKTLK